MECFKYLLPREVDSPAQNQDIEEHWKPASKAVDLIVDRFGAGVIGPVSGLNTRSPGQSPAGPVADDKS
jgi:hypothetical protein